MTFKTLSKYIGKTRLEDFILNLRKLADEYSSRLGYVKKLFNDRPGVDIKSQQERSSNSTINSLFNKIDYKSYLAAFSITEKEMTLSILIKKAEELKDIIKSNHKLAKSGVEGIISNFKQLCINQSKDDSFGQQKSGYSTNRTPAFGQDKAVSQGASHHGSFEKIKTQKRSDYGRYQKEQNDKYNVFRKGRIFKVPPEINSRGYIFVKDNTDYAFADDDFVVQKITVEPQLQAA